MAYKIFSFLIFKLVITHRGTSILHFEMQEIYKSKPTTLTRLISFSIHYKLLRRRPQTQHLKPKKKKTNPIFNTYFKIDTIGFLLTPYIYSLHCFFFLYCLVRNSVFLCAVCGFQLIFIFHFILKYFFFLSVN